MLARSLIPSGTPSAKVYFEATQRRAPALAVGRFAANHAVTAGAVVGQAHHGKAASRIREPRLASSQSQAGLFSLPAASRPPHAGPPCPALLGAPALPSAAGQRSPFFSAFPGGRAHA